MAPTLGYWKIRGLAQPIRMLLGYNGAEFEDKFYEIGDAPDYDRSVWFNEKPTLGLDFPNLPYLIDGDIKITQSGAIMRYLARKFKLDGETEIEKIRIDMIESQVVDFKTPFVMLCYRSTPDNYEAKSMDYKKKAPEGLRKFDEFIKGRTFFASDKLTYVDFLMYELLDVQRTFDKELIEPFENLKAFMKNFENVTEIANFMASDKFFKGLINNKSAQFK